MTISLSARLRVALLFASLFVLTACGQNDQDAPPAANGAASAEAGSGESVVPAVGKTSKFDWYMQGETPAGQTTLVRTGDGRVTSESFVHWNDREWTSNAEVQLDEQGRVISERITGISPFKAPIDETFTYENGVASWSTPGDRGSMQTDDLPFYLANEGLALGSFEAFMRKALTGMDNEVALLPAGTAKVEKVLDVPVDTPDGEQTLTLYAIIGIGFTPSYAWMTADNELGALDFQGYIGMIPEGWNTEVLDKISKIQSEQDGLYIERIAGDLASSVKTPLVFENVNVVDVVNGTVLEGSHVLVSGGKIEAVSGSAIENEDAQRIDGGGRYMIPGLWDMHGHFGLSDGVLNIAGGITNVRNIGGVHEKTMELTAKHDSGEVIGPNTFRAGFMDKKGPYASGWAAASLDEALERVDFYADNGYIQIKLYSSIEPEWVAPIAERAHARGMRLSGHIPAFMNAEQAVRAGYDEIQHINMVFLNFSASDKEDTRQQIRFTMYGDEAGNLDLQSEEVQSFIALLKKNNVTIDPTASIFDTSLIHQNGVPDPSYAAIIDHLPPRFARSLYLVSMDKRGNDEGWAKSAVRQAEMLKLLHDNGIQLVPGSDAVAAFTIHRELELYAEAGISNADVLRIGTLDSARITGVDDRKGSIEVGKDADLVLLDGNPLEDISAIRRGVLVMKGDALFQPDKLYRAVGVKPFLPSIEL